MADWQGGARVQVVILGSLGSEGFRLCVMVGVFVPSWSVIVLVLNICSSTLMKWRSSPGGSRKK
jgi:hypothetical protein